MAEGVLRRLLGGLQEGRDLTDGEYSALSDLDRSDARTLNDAWLSIPVATRAACLERALELADVNVELHFGALGRTGLADPDAEVRERAVALLWESEETDTAETLARLATDDTGPGVRAAAAAGLMRFVVLRVTGKLPEKVGNAAVAALRRAISDPAVEVRANAIESIGAIPEEWAQEAILDAYEGGDDQLRLSAIRAMGYSGLTRWEEYLEEEFLSGNPEIRFEAVVAAGNLGSPLLIEPLAELLNDEDPEIVLAVIEAIGEIGGEDAIELLDAFAPEAPEGFEEAIENARAAAAEEGLFRSFGELDGTRGHDGDEDE
ncbi:MAG: HEAT repeat domain-containing protein [Dehalococcoidia bacterium]|nr:HEAT repeat domain-containing protein [Dehalococcoidia bacterium]